MPLTETELKRDSSPATSPIAWTLAWLGIATAVIIRIFHLGSESLWFDEGYSAWMVSHSPAEIIRLIRADTAPPFYYLLLHEWTIIFGQSEVALRSLSTVFSIATLGVALLIARNLLRNPAAIAMAMWLMALSFLQTWYAQEARAYALMGLLGVLSFYCLQRHLNSTHRRWLIVITLLIAIEMYTHNMMAAYATALVITWPILPSRHPTRRRLAEILIVTLCAIILYLPWAILGLPAQMDMIHHAFWVDPLKRGDFLMAIASLAGVQHFWSWAELLQKIHIPVGDSTRPIFITGCLIVASLFFSVFRQTGDARKNAIGLLAFTLFPPLAVGFYSLVKTPLFTPKLFLPSATLFPILLLLPLGMNLSTAARRAAWTGAALLLILTALTFYSYKYEIGKENWRAIAARVSQLPPQKRLIIFVANDGQLPFDYYYHYQTGDEATGVPSGFFERNPPRTMLRAMSDSDLDVLKSKLAAGDYQQIVLVLAHQFWGDPKHRTRTLIGSSWRLEGQLKLDDVAVEWYGK